MCEACNAPFWLSPARGWREELAFQQARLHGWKGCAQCAELRVELLELKAELRVLSDYYERDSR